MAKYFDYPRKLLRQGSISFDEFKAAMLFRKQFANALAGDGEARSAVREAMARVGGLHSLGGQVVWHCLGMGVTLRYIAGLQTDRQHLDAAHLGGAVVATLGTLTQHYGRITREEAGLSEEEAADAEQLAMSEAAGEAETSFKTTLPW